MKKKNLNFKWLYCFTCGSSHFMSLDVQSSMWKCSNCHSFRMANAEDILKAIENYKRKVQNG